MRNEDYQKLRDDLKEKGLIISRSDLSLIIHAYHRIIIAKLQNGIRHLFTGLGELSPKIKRQYMPSSGEMGYIVIVMFRGSAKFKKTLNEEIKKINEKK